MTEKRFFRFFCLMVHRCLRHRIGVQSAALAFYLLFMFFPFLIFISAILGALSLNVAAVLQELETFLPREVLKLTERYLLHVGTMSSRGLLAFGLVFSIWFPVRASNMLLRAVRTAYHLGPPRRAVGHWLKTLAYAGLLAATVICTVLLMSVSERVLAYGVENGSVTVVIARLWMKLRFPLIGVAGGTAVLLLYALAQDRRVPWCSLWPGVLLALSAWVLLSWLYAWYVENMAHYSMLYGSIGAVIVLLIWLNIGAMALIAGAEFNGVLMSMQKEWERRG